MKISGPVRNVGQKPTNVRERLRQLYRRGLVKRRAFGTPEGKRFFIYEKFCVDDLLLREARNFRTLPLPSRKFHYQVFDATHSCTSGERA